MKADVVVFNPDTVKDTATYDHPDQYATGISWVLVNGKAVVADSKPTNATPGPRAARARLQARHAVMRALLGAAGAAGGACAVHRRPRPVPAQR